MCAAQVFNVGFTTHSGTVAASDEWDQPGQRKAVRKSMPGSYEALLHRAELPEFALELKRGGQELRGALEGEGGRACCCCCCCCCCSAL